MGFHFWFKTIWFCLKYSFLAGIICLILAIIAIIYIRHKLSKSRALYKQNILKDPANSILMTFFHPFWYFPISYKTKF